MEVEPATGTIGQARASEAIAFGLDADMPGYNIFVTGPIGTGKRTSLETQLRAQAGNRPTPGDWVYLHNFREPRHPIALALPCGQGRGLASDMRSFLDDARRELMSALESDTYAQRQRSVTEPIEREREAALTAVRDSAQSKGIAVELTPAGIITIPLRGGRPMTPAEFAQLPDPVRERYQRELQELAPEIERVMTQMRGLQRQVRERLRALEREVALFAVGHLVEDLKARYDASPRLVEWLDAVTDDVLANLADFQSHDGAGQLPEPLRSVMAGGGNEFARYQVNVLVAHESNGGAPVVFETNPTYSNLFGRIEHQGILGGGLVTDHRMLRPGAIHRANGGYLMLPAAEVLASPLIWLKLKESLRAASIRLENPGEQYALIPTTTLTPEPIELDVKVVLVGAAALYELAYRLDEDVRKLFRVKAEFDSQVAWDEQGIGDYARFLASQVARSGLRHFDAGAVARIVEHGARLAEDQERLSTRFVEIAGVASEASHWAARAGLELVTAEQVEAALDHRVRRSNLIEERLLEMVENGLLMIDLDGTCVGQANGLAVLELGDYAFGHPMRITARAGPGRGALVSIERESELSGHIHDKGFLTLTGYLRGQYGGEQPIALSATLTFEQSYQPVDGDSAAGAELFALLSEVAGLPLRQDIAVTGSVNQRGELQAIGAVNEKIEGFFRCCKLKGLTGRQGVLIPEANVRSLMLSPELAESVAAGAFHVWSAADVDGAMELLTGVSAGRRGRDGAFPKGSLHARVAQRLAAWALTAPDLGSEDGARKRKARALRSAREHGD